MSDIENAFERLFEYYRSDTSIREMFIDKNLSISVKFVDTKQKYGVTILSNQSVCLDSSIDLSKPDIKVRVKSEQLFIDLVEGKLPVQEQFTKGRIMITKGLMKIIKIYRKYIGEP